MCGKHSEQQQLRRTAGVRDGVDTAAYEYMYTSTVYLGKSALLPKCHSDQPETFIRPQRPSVSPAYAPFGKGQIVLSKLGQGLCRVLDLLVPILKTFLSEIYHKCTPLEFDICFSAANIRPQRHI